MSEMEKISKRVQKWIIDSINPDARIDTILPLYGGMSSYIYHVALVNGDKKEDYVMRQVDNEEWLDEEPDLALHEMESLRWAMHSTIPTPRPIAFDQTGEICGMPTVLMSKLEGRVILKPSDIDQWLSGLANTLATIHKINGDDFPWSYFTYQDLDFLKLPEWSNLTEKWKKVCSIVTGPQPQARECFIHRDFHAANVLWKDGTVSGVVDWVNACKGPVGIDVGHCRVDLAQLYGVEAADTFLAYYQQYAGKMFHYDPYWDLLSLVDILFGPPEVYPGWPALGMTGLTNDIIAERLELYMQSLLARY